MKNAGKITFGLIGGLFSLLTLLSLFGDWFWLFDTFSHFNVQYVVGLFVSLIGGVWLFEKRLYSLAFVPALLINLFILTPYYIPPTSDQATDSLRVIGINAYIQTDSYQTIADYILKENPDLFFLSEIDPKLMSFLNETVGAKYPHVLDQSAPNIRGKAWFSLHPITDKSVTVGEGEHTRELSIVGIEWQNESVTLVGLHPVAPLGQKDTQIRNEYLQNAQRWYSEQSDHPFVIVGDFNASPWSAPVSKLIDQTNLQHAGKGFGLTPTWHWDVPIINSPIDYILTSHHWQTVNYEVGQDVGSDHLPVIAEIVLTP